MKLTLHEQQALAAIEHGLRRQDPMFAKVMRGAPAARSRRPLSTGQRALLVLLPHLFIVGFSVVFLFGVSGLALITGLLVLLRMICIWLGAPARVRNRPAAHSGGPRR